jgi:uncharacterized protein YdeI (YjbR/CyaY-like superfamily)
VRIKIAKKGAGATSVSRPDALEVALCHGWIDGQAQALDERYWLQRFTPRTPRSKWSKINRESAERLIEQGLMKPGGLAAVERAKQSGTWEAAYDAPSTATVPEDLERALRRNAKARRSFEQLDGQNRYAILYRVQDAKRPETRARRIATFVAMCHNYETLH